MKPVTNFNELHALTLALRGIEKGTECSLCNGSGYMTYGSSATYYGDVGAQTLTDSVCNKCCGSRTKTPQPSHRKARN